MRWTALSSEASRRRIPLYKSLSQHPSRVEKGRAPSMIKGCLLRRVWLGRAGLDRLRLCRERVRPDTVDLQEPHTPTIGIIAAAANAMAVVFRGSNARSARHTEFARGCCMLAKRAVM